MNYTLNQLRIFTKIVELKSITKAAAELNLTQPAVSIQLKNFQNQFDIPLTEVINKRLYITDFGYEISRAAENILNEVYNINYKTLSFQGKLAGKLKLSVVSTGKYVIPYFVSPFMNQFSDLELRIDVTNKAKVIKSLTENNIDFALVSVLPDSLQLNNIELMTNSLYLIGNTEHTFNKKSYSTKLLEEVPLIYREKGSATRMAMEDFIDSNKLKVKKQVELTSNEAVKQAVLAGLGYSIMPLIGLKNELQKNQLQIIPVKKLPIITKWRLVWLKNKNLSPAANAYINFIKENKDSIIKSNFSWIENYLD